MLPILYKKDTERADFFSGNGLGFISKCTKGIVSEERNGMYEAELEILTSDRLAEFIIPTSFLKIKPNLTDEPQIFEIYSISKDSEKITVKAQHVHYLLNGNVFTETYNAKEDITVNQVWEEIQLLLAFKLPFNFNFFSDIETKNAPTAAVQRPIRLGDFLMGYSGSLLDTFGGEYYFNNFEISLLSQRGNQTGVFLRCPAISNFKYEADSENIYNYISPYASVNYKQDEDEIINQLFVFLNPINTGNELLNYNKVLSYDFTEEFSETYPDFYIKKLGSAPDPQSFEEAKDKLKTLTERYINRNKDALTEINLNISLTTNADIAQFSNCKLCDIVNVFYEPMGMKITAKIVKMEYDFLKGRYNKIEIGNVRKGVSRFFSNVNIT